MRSPIRDAVRSWRLRPRAGPKTLAMHPGALPRPPVDPQSRNHEDRHETARCRGIVKWFSDAKGYGFIRGDDGRDVFVHYSAITSTGFRTLAQGQAVEYDVQQSAKGLQAVSVTHPGASPASSARPAGANANSAPRP